MYSMNFAMEAADGRQRGDYECALCSVEKGLAHYPDNELLLNLEGVIRLDLSHYELARECFLKHLNRDKQSPSIRPLTLNNIAWANFMLDDATLLDEADGCSRKAMESMGWLPALRGTRGAVLAAMGRFEEALPMLHGALAQADNASSKANNACLIAMVETKRGNPDEARNYLKEARRLNPKCPLLARAEQAVRDASA